MDDEEKIKDILEEINRCLLRYPKQSDDPELDGYYAVALVLCQSQMKLVKTALLRMIDKNVQ